MVSAQVNGISLLLSMGAKVGKPTLNFYSTAIKGAEQPKEVASPLKTSGSIETIGVYGDPKVTGGGVKFDGSAAQDVIEALKAFQDNEFMIIRDVVKSKVEQELGRKLTEGESFTRLDTHENMQLSKETRKAVRTVNSMQNDLFTMAGEAESTSALLLPSYVPAELDGRRDVDTVEEAAAHLINSRVWNQLGAIEAATEFVLNSPLMDIAFKKLGTEGLSDGVKAALDVTASMEDLRLQLFSQQWDRFAKGDTELNWGNQKLAYTSSMFNGFVSGSNSLSVDVTL